VRRETRAVFAVSSGTAAGWRARNSLSATGSLAWPAARP